MASVIGILAYGSLIDDPGQDLCSLITSSFPAHTPFNVEYARKSKTRDYAPTLTSVQSGGAKVKAKILILDPKINLELAKDLLYRRECHLVNSTMKYTDPSSKSPNMRIEVLANFMNVKSVIYANFPSNIIDISPEALANLAISSALKQAGETKKDGINYLKNNIANGILTPLTQQYEEAILRQSHTNSLQDAIDFYTNERLLSRQ